MLGTWQKQKVKDTRTDLEKLNRCLSTSYLRYPLSFNCYQQQNITTEYFHFSRLLSRVVHICDALHNLVAFIQFKKREKHSWRSVNLVTHHIFEMVTQMISTG